MMVVYTKSFFSKEKIQLLFSLILQQKKPLSLEHLKPQSRFGPMSQLTVQPICFSVRNIQHTFKKQYIGIFAWDAMEIFILTIAYLIMFKNMLKFYSE